MSQAGNYNSGGGGNGGGTEVKLTKFTANGTFNKDARSLFITVLLWNAGGGGGSGRQGVSTMAYGGGGGGGGGFLYLTFPSIQFAASETVTIGAGGAGAPAQASMNSDGIAGTDGGVSSIGAISIYPQFVASGLSNGGGGGTTSPGEAGTPQPLIDEYQTFGVSAQNYGGLGGIPNSSDAPVIGYNNVRQYIASGGGGGARADATTEQAGGRGGNIMNFGGPNAITPDILQMGGAGGTESGTIDGTAGTDFVSTTGGRMTAATGGGGGGGQHVGLAAGNGANAGIPSAGGGGGGGSLNGTTSGAGGDGARGEIWVIETLGTLTL